MPALSIVVFSVVIRVDAVHFVFHVVGIVRCEISCSYSIEFELFFLQSLCLFSLNILKVEKVYGRIMVYR